MASTQSVTDTVVACQVPKETCQGVTWTKSRTENLLNEVLLKVHQNTKGSTIEFPELVGDEGINTDQSSARQSMGECGKGTWITEDICMAEIGSTDCHKVHVWSDHSWLELTGRLRHDSHLVLCDLHF